MKTGVSLHHTHLVTNDIDRVCRFYGDNFDAKVVFDDTIDGDRNVFMKIGDGRIHLFESRNAPPTDRNSFHHLGLLVEDLIDTLSHLQRNGVAVTEITDVPGGRFAMASAPDNVLLELFEVEEGESRRYFVG
ncbi:VOC family protein [Rhodococcus sp. CSLK01-03]|uniref:VOC family protein n=1 Tax=Rhodococcus indonesiensis TaxID=3055869 RepID=A0ABT7RP03_9NOCA|nr:VOC family protein [Rhodococcus indonesiensis]MDM7489358.1 VOC family protein [Rhodococcus indonesiensis]